MLLHVYPHVLPSTGDAVEWVEGTMLTRLRRRLPVALYEEFVQVYRDELLAALGDRRPLFFPFSRILFWAQRSA